MAAAVLEVLARAAVVVAGPAPQCAATAWQVVMGHLALGTDAAAGCRVGCVLGSPGWGASSCKGGCAETWAGVTGLSPPTLTRTCLFLTMSSTTLLSRVRNTRSGPVQLGKSFLLRPR